MDAGPFYLAAGSQVVGVVIQKIIDMLARGQYDAIIDDGSENEYEIPTRLSQEALSRQWTRDSDVLLAALFAGTIVSFALEDLEQYPNARYLIGGVGVFLPIVAMVLILITTPNDYWRRSLFRKSSLPISPFVYVAAPLALLLGLFVQFVL